MSPRGSSAATPPNQSARGTSAPYSRRSASQPKSSRQQFSACGACRMRRVRCDLKDLPIGFAGPHPACSNCKERGIKCVDEFADVKAVKLLRRGRRLQQVEAIYGKVNDRDNNSSQSSLPARSPAIPALHPDFFNSPFWRWFSIHRPILDAAKFATRFISYYKGAESLGNEAKLISMVLVAWAASFGLNECGFPDTSASADGRMTPVDLQDRIEGHLSSDGKYMSSADVRRQWRARTEVFVREILELIDAHGILRRPTLDGVRLLLLLLPLLEDAQPMERVAVQAATLSQVRALCVGSVSAPEDVVTRGRIFWYAYSQESLTAAITGSRYVLMDEDLESFQRTLPSSLVTLCDTGLPSPPTPPSMDLVSTMSTHHVVEAANLGQQYPSSQKALMDLMHWSSHPLQIGGVCRRIHDVVTGLRATRRVEDHGVIDANGLRDIWRSLDRSWQDLDAFKRSRQNFEKDLHHDEVSQYADAWQLVIFECHNVIRESLKRSTSSSTLFETPSSRPSSHSSNSSPYLSPQPLYDLSVRKCLALLPRVLDILRMYAARAQGETPGIFQFDTGLVRDGCWFAAYLTANLDGDFVEGSSNDAKQNRLDPPLSVDEGFSICLTALSSMRWAFSKSEEREGTTKMIWENRKLRRQGHGQHPSYDADYSPSLTLSIPHLDLNLPSVPHTTVPIATSQNRPMLRPLNLFKSHRTTESAPNTACSSEDRGSNSWPSYTPPGTATSAATSTGTGLSRRGSPEFTNMNTFKSMDDVFYHGGTEVDQFTYSMPAPAPMMRGNTAVIPNAHYGSRPSHLEQQALSTTAAPNYMVTPSFHDPNSTLLTQADFHTCPQFGENCSGTYH